MLVESCSLSFREKLQNKLNLIDLAEKELDRKFGECKIETLKACELQLQNVHNLHSHILEEACTTAKVLHDKLSGIKSPIGQNNEEVDDFRRYMIRGTFAAEVLGQLVSFRSAVNAVQACVTSLDGIEATANEALELRRHVVDTEVANQQRSTGDAHLTDSLWLNEPERTMVGLLREVEEQPTLSLLATVPGQKVLKQLKLYKCYQDCVVTFKECEKPFLELVRDKLDKAIADNDQDAVSRHAKIFRPLGLSNEATEKFADFVCARVRNACAPTWVSTAHAGARIPYAEMLTKLFVSIADAVEEHEQNALTNFGPIGLITLFRGLQLEADVHGTHLLTLYHNEKLRLYEKNDSVELDLRDLDETLDQVTLLSQRCHQFDKYIRTRSAEVLSSIDASNRKRLLSCTDQFSQQDGLLILSDLLKQMQEVLGVYVTLEQRFIISSLRLAMTETDEVIWDDPEILYSTCIEDAFFIFHKSVTRAIAGSDIFAACAVVNHVVTVLSTEFKTQMESNVQSSKPLYSSYIHGRQDWTDYTPARNLAEAELNETLPEGVKGAAYSWTHSVNNLQACIEFIDRFHLRCAQEFDDRFSTRAKNDDATIQNNRSARTMFQHTLQSLEEVKTDFEGLQMNACRLTLNVLKGHLTESLEPLDTLSYDLTQDEYAEAQVNDPFVLNFIEALKNLHEHLKKFYTPATLEICIQLLIDRVCKRVEMAVRRKSGFTLLGAVQLDTEVRALMAFFSDIAAQSVRSKFGRLIEIGDLLNLTSLAEYHDFIGDETSRRLTIQETQQVLSLRLDFEAEAIENIIQENS